MSPSKYRNAAPLLRLAGSPGIASFAYVLMCAVRRIGFAGTTGGAAIAVAGAWTASAEL